MLNSKTEYNRSKVGRLTLGEEDRAKSGAENKDMGEEISTEGWERNKAKDRRTIELNGRVDLARGVARSIATKRGIGEDIEGAKRGKRKFPLLGEDWGESTDPQKIPNNEHSPTPKEDTAPQELQKIYMGGGSPS